MNIFKMLFLLCFFFVGLSVLAGSIQYGYNANGDYVPTSINGQRVQYGYNANGNYVPTSIGGNRIQPIGRALARQNDLFKN